MDGKELQNRVYMQRAIELASKAGGWAAPNPMVGAVIVKNGMVIGEGYHRKCGELHAERNAFASLTEDATGAEMYVTLEPCCHYGRTPPCTEAIIQHGIFRVYIGSRDPNPLVSGKGAEILREHGIEVIEDFMREECDKINPMFFKYITTGMPYVVLKYAMTLDGKIASVSGKSKWITGEVARAHVHSLRGQYPAILSGVGTVLADDPMLNCRLRGAHQPLRVIVDSHLRTPPDSNIIKTAGQYPTLIACTEEADTRKAAVLKAEGADIEVIGKDENGHVDLKALMKHLGKMDISGVLIEGGGEINDSALRAGIVDHVCAYIAPKLLGGGTAKTPVGGTGFDSPDEAVMLTNRRITDLGGDILLEYDVGGK